MYGHAEPAGEVLGCTGDTVEYPGDSNFCNGVEICNPLSGACEAAALDCDDGNVCTDDSCNETAPTLVEAISETLMHQTVDRAQDARTIIQGVKANLR